MKKITLFLTILCFTLFTWQGMAQTFAGSTGAVPDNACPVTTDFTATATGIGTLGTTNQFDEVVINISHTWGSDLEVWLLAPDGITQVELTTGNGGNGTQYIDTHFRADAGASITTGSGDFTGNWLPEGDLSTLNGLSGDGTWTLQVCDNTGGDTGTVDSWEITFVPVPACPNVTGLTAGNYTSPDSADLSWDMVAGATGYNWEIQPLGTAQGTPGAVAMGSAATNSTTATGLVDGTDYTAYVQADCGGGILGSYNSTNFSFILPPANDLATGAIAVACGDTVMGDTSVAGVTIDVQGDCGSVDNDAPNLWYSFTGTGAAEDVTVSLCGSSYDTSLAVYTGTPGALVCLANNDDSAACGDTTSQLVFTSDGVQTYYIMVEGWNATSVGAFTMAVTCVPACTPAVANQDCGTATALTSGTMVSSDNTCATTNVNNPGCDAFGTIADVWFSFVAPASGETDVETVVGTAAAAHVAVYSGACGALVEEACSDVGGGETLSLTGLTGGDTYYIQVWNNGAEEGTFDITVTDIVCPDVVNLGAGNFTAPDSADLSWDMAAGATGYNWEIQPQGTAQGTPGAVAMGTEVTNAATATGLVDGTDYTLYVQSDCGGTLGAYVSFDFTFSLPPANDLATGAIAVACGDTVMGDTSVTGVTIDVQGDCGSVDNDAPNLWYSFTGTGAAEDVTVSLCGSSYDTSLAIYTGTPGALVCLANNDDSCGTQSELTFTSDGAQTYYIMVEGWNATSVGAFTMAVTCVPACTPAVANQDCATAMALTVDAAATSSDNTCATTNVNNPGCDPFGTIADVWFSFVAPLSGEADVVTTLGTATASHVAVYSGACGALVEEGCSATGADTVNLTGLTAGDTYYVQVWNDGAEEGTFDIAVTDPNPVTCGDPSMLTATNITTTTADLGWTAGADGETMWDVQWGAPGFTVDVDQIGSADDTTDNPYNVTGLTVDTDYEFYVRAVCPLLNSNWVGPFAFSTVGCGDPSALTATNILDVSADLGWTAGADGETMWDVEWGAPGFTPEVDAIGTADDTMDNPYSATGLTASTDYEFYVRAVCPLLNSNWVGPFAFTTLPPQPPVNDTFAGAIPITPSAEGTGCAVATFTLPFSTDLTTDSGLDNTGCSASGLDQFFTWTATSIGLTFSSQAPGNPGIVIYDDMGTQIDCTNTFATQELSGWNIGDNLVIQIYDFAGSTSDVAFCLEELTGFDPEATYTVVDDCPNNQFSVDIDVTNLGGATTVTVADDQGSPDQAGVGLGVVTFGPYAVGTTVNFTVTSDDNPAFTSGGSGSSNCPPPNDLATGAIAVACGDTVMGDTSAGATVDVQGDCGSVDNDAPNMWYSFTGTGVAEDVTLDLCASGYDTSVAVYTGTPGALVCLANNDDSAVCGNTRSHVTFTSDGVQTYYIMVEGWNATSVGAFTMSVTCVVACTPAVANQDCATAMALTVDAAATSSDNTCATTNVNNPSCDAFGTISDVWFSFVAPLSGEADVVTTLGTATASHVAVYSGACGALVEEGCSDIGADTVNLTGLTAGDTYYVQVWNNGTEEGTFDIAVTDPNPVTCGDPSMLTATNITTTTADLGWTAGADGETMWDVQWGAPGFTVDVDQIGSADDTADNPYNVTGLTAGTDYEFYVRAVCPLLNSNWVGPFAFSTVGCGDPSALTATNILDVSADLGWTAGADGEAMWDVQWGAPGFTVDVDQIGSADDTMDNPYSATGLTASTDYEFYVRAVCPTLNSNWVGPFAFTTLPPQPPVNDLFAGAIPITPSAEGTGCAVATFTLPFSTDNTTDSGLQGGCSTSGLDQFFTWTATTDALTFSSQAPGNPGIVVYDDMGTEIACLATFSDGTLSGWSIGDNLVIQIYDFEGSTSDVAFCLEEFMLPPPPPNDLATGAIAVACGDTVMGDTSAIGVTVDVQGDCGSVDNDAPNLWYSFTGTGAAEDVTVSLCGSSYDTSLAIYTGTPGALVCLANNDDSCGTQSELTFTSDGVQTYYIMVEGWNATSVGAFTMAVTCVPACTPAVANQDCAMAMALTVDAAATSSDNTCATTNVNNPGCDPFGTIADVWFSFVAPASGEVDVATVLGTATDAHVAVYSGACGALVEEGCSDVGGGDTVNLTGLTAGDTYYVQVWNDGAEEGTFDISVVDANPPMCGDPSALTATNILDVSADLGWTAGADGETMWDVQWGAPGFTIDVDQIGSADDTMDNPYSATGLTASTDYEFYVRAVCPTLNSNWVGPFAFTTLPPQPPVNDVFAGAIPIVPSPEGTGCATPTFTLPFSTDLTTDSGLQGGCSASGLDQFFTWTATTDALTFSSQAPGNPGIVVYDDMGTEIACLATFSDGTLSGWSIGDNLVIQIYDFEGTALSDVAFCLEELMLPPPPANDLATGAIAVACGDTVMGDTSALGVTVDVQGDCGSVDNDAPNLWYSFTGTGAAEDVTLDLCASSYDTSVAVYTGTPGALVCLANNDDSCGTQSVVSFTSDGVQTYYIMVEGWNAGSVGAFTMAVTCVPACTPAVANQDCASALAVTVDGGAVSSDNTCATTNVNNPGCDPFGTISDVWFSFVAPASGIVDISTVLGTAAEANVAVYSGACGALVEEACSDDNGGEAVSLNGLVAGDTYYVQVWNDGAEEGTFDITITSINVNVPDCATNLMPADGAVDIVVFPLTFNLTWDAPVTGDAPDSYNVYAGTAPGALTLFANTTDTFINDVNVGTDLTTIYWMVVPVNAAGEAVGCPEVSFTTMDQTADNDGDGVNNGTEATNGNDINDPCDPMQAPGYTGYDSTNPVWQAEDCDGDGQSNIDEFNGGSDPYDPASTVSLEDLESVGFNYYPNPVTRDLHLTANENITSVAIFNLIGQEVKRVTPSELETTIDMSNLAVGTYFVRAQVGDAVGTFKIIKK